MPNYYPAFLDLRGRLVVVVGGGRVAARKVQSLLAAGARVRLVAPSLAPETIPLTQGGRVDYIARGFEPSDLEGACLAVSATDLEAVNRQVRDEADRRGLFVNVVDVPSLCTMVVPAVLRRGDLTLAVSTGGASPAMARRLREGLEEQFGPEWGPYLKIMRALRAKLTALGRPAQENRPLFFALADSPLLARVAARDWAGVDGIVASILGPGFELDQLGLGPRDLELEPL